MKKNDVALLVGVILIKVATGMAMGLFGPMLPSLANSTSVSIATAGWIFATRSFAIFAGGCATGSIFHRLNPALFLFCTAVIQLASLYYIPLVDNFGLLLFLVFCIGCGIGMVDVGGQSIILKKFKRDSTQLIQLFHFVFNCGAILGNTIVGAYIEPAAETPCKGEIRGSSMMRNATTDTFNISSRGMTSGPEIRGAIKDDFSAVFQLPAALTTVPVVVFFFIWVSKLIEKMTCSTKLKKEQTQVQLSDPTDDDVDNERPKWSEVRLFIVILTVALFCNTSSQQVVEAYIYEYSRCSKTIALDSESAATVVNIFWVTSTIARGTAIIISRITSPKTYIIFDYILATGALGMLLITPLISHVYLVVAVIAFGFSIATLYANVIIYTVSVFNVENGFMWVFYVGAQLLPTFNPVLCGSWMGADINGFVYFNFITMLISVISLPFMFKIGQDLINTKQAEMEQRQVESTSIETTPRPGPIPAQLVRLTEVERVVQVSTSVNSIALSILSNKTFTSGHTVEDDIISF